MHGDLREQGRISSGRGKLGRAREGATHEDLLLPLLLLDLPPPTLLLLPLAPLSLLLRLLLTELRQPEVVVGVLASLGSPPCSVFTDRLLDRICDHLVDHLVRRFDHVKREHLNTLDPTWPTPLLSVGGKGARDGHSGRRGRWRSELTAVRGRREENPLAFGVRHGDGRRAEGRGRAGSTRGDGQAGNTARGCRWRGATLAIVHRRWGRAERAACP